MRIATAASLLVLGLAGCDNGKTHLHPEAGPDAPADRWWKPAPGEARNWDVQVAPPFDVSAARSMYMLDLWAVTTATSIDYGDGDPVVVPAGPLAGTITMLQARTPTTIVICRVGTGAIRLSDPDARKFPGFEASPPDRPTPLAVGSAIGWSTLEPDERFLDIRAGSRGAWAALIWKRLELAKQLGCDGIDADRNDMLSSDPGFMVEVAEQLSWYVEVARQAHDRELSVGMKNGTTIPGQIDQLADDYDWMLVERCGEYDDCDTTRPFINARRAVFAIDYQNDFDGAPQVESLLCDRQNAGMIDDGLVKDDALSSTYRHQCIP